ncbi:unnamed protein product [marine sediment metagenome]|uniref:Mutator family transposase n=1 Tax=marine sediment metagenome TaxID=412755 RepID=X0SC79_9ZZZZ
MAQYQVSVDSEKVKELMIRDDGLKELVQEVLNQVLEAQASEAVGAERYERSEGRQGYRNGYRERKLIARIGTLSLRIPQIRDGVFSPELFRRYQRSEQGFVLALMEMVLQGVSTRKVGKVTEELCGASFSKSMVSELCKELQIRVDAWNERPLEGQEYPFVIVDAMVIKVRKEEKVRSVSALIVSGINTEGFREILGMRLGDSETEVTWREIFQWLKDRGLRGVDYVVSDAHKGLIAAVQRCFQGVVWQRCQVHFMRNVLGHTSRRHQKAMITGLKKILGAYDRLDAKKAFEDLAEELTGKADSALQVLEEGLEDALAVLGLPEKYRRRMKSTNMQERLIQEIRRRERVIRIFPNEASALRLIGALLAEKHETWSTGKKYFDMTEYLEVLEEEEKKEIAVKIPKAS